MAIIPPVAPVPIKYVGDESCPKCGARNPSIRHVERDECQAAEGRDHIHLRCASCGFGADEPAWIAFSRDS